MMGLKEINTIATVIGATVGTFELMMKTFNWYNKKHVKDKNVTYPIIKGI